MSYIDLAIFLFILFGEYVIKALVFLFFAFITYGAWIGIRSKKEIEELKKILGELLKPKKAINAKFYLIKNGQKVRLEKMEVQGKQDFEGGIEWKDDSENKANVESAKIMVSDESMATIEMASDGLSFKAKSTGKAGEFHFIGECDAKEGEGEIMLRAESEVIVVKPGQASKGVISVKLVMQPEPIPEPQPEPVPEEPKPEEPQPA